MRTTETHNRGTYNSGGVELLGGAEAVTYAKLNLSALTKLNQQGHIRRSVLNYSDPEEDKASSVNYKIYNTSFYNTRVFDEKMKQGN